MAIATYETSDTVVLSRAVGSGRRSELRFSAGDIVRVSGERGTWTVKSFRNDRGGWTAIVHGDGAIRCFLVERLSGVSKRKRATIGAES